MSGQDPGGQVGPESTRAEPTGARAAAGTVRQQLLAAATGPDGQVDLMAAMGGVRGVLESVLPFTVFTVVYGVWQQLTPAVLAALAPAVVLGGWRLLRRESVAQALGGMAGVALGAVIAVRTGRAENFFLPTLLKNAGYGLAYAVSVLLRWPLMGLLIGLVSGEGTSWRADRRRYRTYAQVTWVWAALFGVRLVVQVPLYLAGRTEVLGAVNVVLGLPLFALTVWVSWLLVRRERAGRPETGDPAPVQEPAQPG